MNGREQLTIWTKICGVTNLRDAEIVASAGAQAVGINFVPSSVRRVGVDLGIEIAAEARLSSGRSIQVIGVFANQSREEILDVSRRLALDGIQLHGDESPEELNWYLGQGYSAFKAVRIGNPDDVVRAAQYRGQWLLVDAKVGDALGGTGHTFEWPLIADLNATRNLILAGGLKPENVEGAIRQVHPFGVDTASGVESAPGIKDAERVRAFVESCLKAEIS